MDRTQTSANTAELDQIEHGWDVYAADGEKLGDVSEVRDDYLVVSKGWLFTTERYVPFSAIARVEPDRVVLQVMKDQFDAQNWGPQPEDIDTEYEEHTASAAAGTSTTTDDDKTLQLREEELRANKQTVKTGEVQIHKEVVAEQQTLEVPVTREEVVIERRPVSSTEAARMKVGEIREGESIRVPLREEQVTVEKTPVVTEEIEVGKRTVQETQRVSDTVRREEVSVDHDDEVEVHHRQANVPHANEHRRA
jgi:uncharacterized protein (TIGR02271 family)